jgi:nitroimidazol reductase NimA-like FMN-containing flavoprotein (pyridoxamine 5'-phosphate oxidase superfamily)
MGILQNGGEIMSDHEEAVLVLKELLDSQYLGVLGTQGDGQPHTSLVAFIASDQLDKILFVTPRSTRKYQNLKKESRVAFLIDNRSQRETDFHDATAATAYGRVRELKGEERHIQGKRYLQKFPFLEKFLVSPTCAMMVINVHKYSIVNKFQNVVEFYPG